MCSGCSVYNLEGNKVDGGANPHFGDTAADGTYVTLTPSAAAHLASTLTPT